jgi:hypothetical protein
MAYISTNETNQISRSMTQVYAVFAEDSQDFYAQPELRRLFGTEADAEVFAATLRASKLEPDMFTEGAPAEDEFSVVYVSALGIH